MTQTLTCTECDAGTLHPAIWEGDFRHGGSMIHVSDLECYRCDMCAADPVFPEQIRRNQLKIADTKRRAEGLLTGHEVLSLREQLGLTQPEAAELFGGGVNAFSKYERGDVLQSVAMDRLLKAAAFFPDLLDFLRLEAGLANHSEQRSKATYGAGNRLPSPPAKWQPTPIRSKPVLISDRSWKREAA